MPFVRAFTLILRLRVAAAVVCLHVCYVDYKIFSSSYSAQLAWTSFSSFALNSLQTFTFQTFHFQTAKQQHRAAIENTNKKVKQKQEINEVLQESIKKKNKMARSLI